MTVSSARPHHAAASDPAVEDTDSDWAVCDACRGVVYRTRLRRALRVCPDCGHHHRLSAPERLSTLLDPGSVRQLDFPVAARDPLDFTDTQPYAERLARARAATGLDEAVLCARGSLAGRPVVVAVMDFRFLGGSLGSAVGELVTRAAEEALRTRTPFLVVTASGGARMQEGAHSLMQMAKTGSAFARLRAAGVFTVSLITDPTYGGVAASFATLADVIVAESGTRLGFAGPRVIEQTIRQRLPDGFQTAEFLLQHGLVDGVYRRGALRPALARLLAAADRPAGRGPAREPLSDPAREPAPDPAPNEPPEYVVNEPPEYVVTDPALLPDRAPWPVVKGSRALERPTVLDYAGRVLDGFEELRGDRASGDCAAMVGGIGTLDGVPVMLIGHQKGHTHAELAARNYAMASPAGYRKAGRLMCLAARLGLPVVTLIDTPGAHPGIEAEEKGQAFAIAESLCLMSTLPVPVVAVVIGEGGSGGALGLAVADHVLICENATYSVISPEGCAAILWQDPAAAPRAADELGLVPERLLRHGIVDGVLREPDGGAHTDPGLAAERLRGALRWALRDCLALSPAELVARRTRRYRDMDGSVRHGEALCSARY
ncbi:acetyl-CoA carboxylase, carboxyltransferase subunit beta [Streptomyces kanamyceticus]|uniref:Multifunctional fusion protein n=1 Tax=Streptomyces kanamyceticus TaxID=1967 RepID=A0A5J6G6Y6_STRKN|nr:acetyl-CoA carboxylase, carboxyltransferase subunit beta [Streptomyces kanamyceticus]QEU90753.1 acetyl-CoA carboxylase, carboxyltransferase subunit beta [Streptomyces kanamyceticus]